MHDPSAGNGLVHAIRLRLTAYPRHNPQLFMNSGDNGVVVAPDARLASGSAAVVHGRARSRDEGLAQNDLGDTGQSPR